MKLEEVINLIKVIDSTNIDYIKLEIDNLKLETSRNNNMQDICTTKSEPYIEQEECNSNKVNNNYEVDANIIENTINVSAPLMGTFYNAPSPTSDPFVNIGTIVKKGDTLCIVEAMKLMNEITSDLDGEIVDILVSNEELVEYNQVIFKIKPI